ncbi:MAG: tripartite tricarboxylate transporter substrate binding protein [Betaproteobacteria bacterium]|nr:tripartite tricarboxylate transporter substrate binding protein [Betaproteobacteria bacterium]
MLARCIFLALVAMVLPGGSGAGAQTYPNKPIRMVTSAPGGGTDFVTRLIAQGLTANLGKQIVVDNRPSGILIGDIVAKSAPDGYTMFLNGSAFWLQPFLQKNTPYDPVKDFTPITLTTKSPNILVVNPPLPVRSVKELIALAKARPGELNYGSSSAGTPTHLGAELFRQMTGINIVRVAYKGNGPALIALIAGEVQLMFANAASVSPHVKSGRLKALAVASIKPTALAPGLPTVASAGLPDFESSSTYGVFAPARMPRQLVDRINREMVKVLTRAEVKDRLFKAGMDVVASTPDELGSAMKSDMTRMEKVIRNAGISAGY